MKKAIVIVALFSVLVAFCLVLEVRANPFSFVPTTGPQIEITKRGVYSLSPTGSYTPSTDIVQRNDGVYYLTKDLKGMWCIGIGQDVILDGAGHSIDSDNSNSIGISIRGVANVTIRNVRIQGFRYGIGLLEANYCSIENVTLTNNSEAIHLQDTSNYNQITNNSIYKNACGIFIGKFSSVCTSNVISGNSLISNQIGISIFETPSNTFYENTIDNSTTGVFLEHANYFSPIPSNNIFYYNNFGFNSQQVSMKEVKNASSTVDASYPNNWNYNGKGNYWSDYNGNGTYVIDQNNVDHHPLTQPIDINEPAPTPTPSSMISNLMSPLTTTIIVIVAVVVLAVIIAIVLFRRHRKTPKA